MGWCGAMRPVRITPLPGEQSLRVPTAIGVWPRILEMDPAGRRMFGGRRSTLGEMETELFEHHLASPQGAGAVPRGAFEGVAGGSICGDLVRFGIVVEGERVADAGFVASG